MNSFDVNGYYGVNNQRYDNKITALPGWERAQQAWEYHWSSYLNVMDISKMRSKDTLPVIRTKYHSLNF